MQDIIREMETCCNEQEKVIKNKRNKGVIPTGTAQVTIDLMRSFVIRLKANIKIPKVAKYRRVYETKTVVLCSDCMELETDSSSLVMSDVQNTSVNRTCEICGCE